MNNDAIKSRMVPALTRQLDSLAKTNHTGVGRLTEQLKEICLKARLGSVDRLACQSESIAVSSPILSDCTVTQMRELADHLAGELSYLEERLAVFEIDQITPEVRIRSESPQTDVEARAYFEVQVGRSGISLKRFEKQPGHPRKVVPAVLTRGIFRRLCVDLVLAVQQ